MDTKVLRQKVLDLAIRGKLVPQDPNDEPASVLLERIRQQKQQMVKDGKLKAKDIKNDTIIFVSEDNLHYEKFADGSVKCIEDEIPFELPDGWAWSRLGAVAEAIGDGDHQPPPQTSFGVPFLVISNVSGGRLSFENTRFVSKEYFSQLPETRKPRNGDLLFTVTGSYGIPVLIDSDDKFCFQRHIAIVRPCTISNRYLYVILGSSYVKSICDAKATGTAQKTVGLATLRELLIPVAPYKEQMQIYAQTQDALSIVDSVSSDKEDLLNIIESAKAKILDLAIRGQLVPQDPTDEPASVLLERIRAEKEELIKQGKIKRDKKESVIFRGEDNSYYEKMADGKLHCLDDQLPFELPDGWEWCNLSMIGTTNIGITYRPTDIELGGIMVLRSCNIVNDQVDLSGLVRVKTTVRENQFAQKNDILICARNGSRSLVGKCALIPDLREPASFGAFMAIYRTEYFEFIVHYLRSSFFRSVFDDSNSTAINQLTQDMLKRAIVPLPPLSEQRRIVEAIGAMLFELNQIEKSLS
jgi:type I restriction enzyme S subunit